MTPRHRQALMLAARGWTTAASARYLGLSEKTVKAHLTSARVRLGARNTTHAVVLALAVGEVTLEMLTFPLAQFENEPQEVAS